MKNKTKKRDWHNDAHQLSELQRAVEEKRGADAVRILSRLQPDTFDPPALELAAHALALRALQNYTAGAPLNAIIADLSLAVRYEPSNPAIQFHLGLAYLKQRLYTKALRALRSAVELQPGNTRYLYHAAWAAAVSNHPETEAWLRRLEAAGEDASRFRRLCVGPGDPAPQDVAATDSGIGRAAQIAAGNREIQNGNLDQALERFEAAQKGGLDAPELSVCVSQLRVLRIHQKLRAGDLEDAQDDLNRMDSAKGKISDLVRKYTAFVDAARALGLAKHGNLVEAISLWKKVAEHKTAALHNIALAYERLEDFGRAAAYWNHWMRSRAKESPDPALAAETWRRIGACLLKTEAPETAAEAYRALLRLAPDDVEAREQLASLCLHEEEWNEAIRHLEYLQKNHQETSTRWTQIGRAYWGMIEIKKAREAWQRALELEPENRGAQDSLLMALSSSLNEMSRKEYAQKGLKAIQEAMLAMPKNPMPQIMLAEYFFNLGHRKRGQESLERALAMEPANATLWERGLHIYMHNASANQIRAFSERFVKLHGNNSQLMLETGRSLLEHDKDKPARAHFQAALQASPNSGTAGSIAYSYLDAGCFDEAESYARLALERDPRNGDALGVLAETLFEQGRYEEAMACVDAGRSVAKETGNKDLLEELKFLAENFNHIGGS